MTIMISLWLALEALNIIIYIYLYNYRASTLAMSEAENHGYPVYSYWELYLRTIMWDRQVSAKQMTSFLAMR